jgi:hypothetical protein
MQSPQKSFWQDPLFWPSLLIGGFFLSLTLWFNLGMDQSIFAYTAWVWKQYHLAPYIGVWNQTFPGIFVIHRLALEFFGDTVFAFRLLDFLVQLSSLFLIFYLARKLSGFSISGFLASIFYGIYYYGLGISGAGQRECFVFWILLVCLAMAVAVEKRILLRALLSGILLGFAFLLKPTFALAWLVFGAWYFAQSRSRKTGAATIELVIFFAACLLPILITIACYWRLDALATLYQSTIWFNSAIYDRMSEWPAELRFFLTSALSITILENYPLLFLGTVLALALHFKKLSPARDLQLLQGMISLMGMGILSYAVQGKYFPYHLVPFAGLMTIMAGWAFGQLIFLARDLTKSAFGRFGITALGLFPIIFMLASLDPWGKEFAVRFALRDFDRAYAAGFATPQDRQMSANYYLAAKYLKPMLRPQDNIACFGPDPLIPFLLQKKLPTWFPCVQHLLFLRHDGKIEPLQQEWITEFQDQIIKARPRFILVSNNFPGQYDKLFNFMNRDLGKALDQQFPQLKIFIRQNYRLRQNIGYVQIYEILF